MANRTEKSLKNAQISLLYYSINLLLGFWSRSVFFDYLGSEVLGLDATSTSLLGFLNIAELGIGMSVSYFLYQPIFDKNENKINEIVTLQGWIYRRIGALIIIAALILMAFFPLIFEETSLPLWYAYATFSVMLFGSLLSYFINYRQIVLAADQKNYKVTIATSGIDICLKILLILLLPVVSCPFILYLSTSFFSKIFGSFWLNHIINKEYPWLKNLGNGKIYFKKYSEIYNKTKQIFIHRLAGFAVVQATPLIMYAFTSLSVIACYGNYLVLTTNTTSLLSSLYNSTGAGIGNLIATKDKNKIIKVFWELLDSRLFISWVALFSVLFLSQKFIPVWLGTEYLMSDTIVLLLVISSAIFINRTTVDSFINGHGLFQDTWCPIFSGFTNLVLSIIFGYFWNVTGVILGGIISQSIFIGLWKPYFLFIKGFNISPWNYFIPFIRRCIILGGAWGCIHFATSWLNSVSIDSYISFFKYGFIVFLEILTILFTLFYVFTHGMKDFCKRIYNELEKKLRK